MSFRLNAGRRWRRLLAALWLAALAAPFAHATDTYTRTRHPIVLVHGLFGFDAIGPVDYFWGVASALRSGGATVYVPQQSAVNRNEVRGEQLLAQLRQLKAAHGHARFHLIGHSQGGLSARYVAAVAPELVASVTTVGTPHQGSRVADGLRAGFTLTGTTPLAAAFFNLFGGALGALSGRPDLPQDADQTLAVFETDGARRFNRRFGQGAPTTACGQGPAVVGGIAYFSVGGTAVLTNPLDPAELLLGTGALFFAGEANDGLVSRCSSRWGQVLRDNYPWNHLDEINHAFGLRGVFTPDPIAFYRSHANRLKRSVDKL